VPRIDDDGFVSLNTVSEDYFATLDTPLLRGRAFTASDTREAPAVAVLNESAVRHFFADRDPIGVVTSLNGQRYQVVGIVQDVKQHDLRQKPGRFVYISLRQPYDRNFHMTLAVRAAVPPESLIGSIQERVRGLGSDILIGASRTLVQQLDESLLNERLISSLATAFGVVALTLAAVGLYGVLAYAVAQRRAEIAIRMALGAQRAFVVRSILTHTMWLVTIGVAVGVPLSMLFASAAAGSLYGITSRDAAVLEVGAALLLTAVSLVASYLPARRASLVDPLSALRCE
jgi:ABC-type antimicrobial peptide transport system permease subunit